MINAAVCLSLFGLLAQVAAQNLCNRMDLVFLVDSSSSVHNTNFQLVKTQLSSVLDYFRISSGETRIGVITYGTEVFEVVPFSGTKADLRQAISQLNYQNGGTDTNKALDRAVQMFQQSNRQDVAKVVVLVTDGMSTNPSLTLASASNAKSQGVQIYVIGVGDNVNSNELNSVATSANGNYVFTVSLFSSLATKLVEFASTMCLIETTTRTTTMTTTPYLVCDKQLDVIFVLDGSSSVRNVNFQSAVSSLINTVQFFMPGASRTRIGAITYATGIFQSLPLTDDRSVITKGLSALTYPNGGTDTDKAIRAATAELLSKKQSGVPQIMVVITDGLSTNPPATLQAAAEAKQAGISIYALGIGLNDNTELQAISSDQNQMYHVETFQNLTSALASSVVDVCRAVSAPNSPIATTPMPFPTFTPSNGVCNKALDIVVLMDASSTVGTANFELMKLYLLTFLRLFVISPSQARFGGLCYGSRLSGTFGPSDTESATVNAILRLPYLGDSVRYTDTAITSGSDLLYTNRRSGGKSTLVILTTGASINPTNTISRVQDALNTGINVYAIGIGSNQGLSELTRVLPGSRLRFASSWASLPSTLRDVASDICS